MYKLATTISEVEKYLSTSTLVGFDFETTGLDSNACDIVGVSFSVSENNGIYYPSPDIDFLRNFAESDKIKVAHNLAFEAMFLYKHGTIIKPPYYDTIAASQLTLKNYDEFRKLSDSGLKTLVPELFGVELPTFEAVTNGQTFDKLELNTDTIRYACSDADYCLRLYHKFNTWFDKYLPRHRWLVENIESATAVYCGIMKHNGIKVDVAKMKAMQIEITQKIAETKSKIAYFVGDIDIGETATTKEFKEYLGVTELDDSVLITLAENKPELKELCGLVQEYRKLGKLKSTYIDGYLKFVKNGKIHADLFPLSTETGRFAARNPNLQNMPRAERDEVGVRNFFIASKGKVFLSLDFSQIELRVGSFYCRDEKMLDTYNNNGDIHDSTATVIFGSGKHNKEQRTIAKNVNFGTFYGLYANGLQRTLKFKAGIEKSKDECQQIIDNLKNGYPRLAKWQNETIKTARLLGYSETSLGRRRMLPNIKSKDWCERSYAERCALNTPIQGTAADILKLAIVRILQGLKERDYIKPILQIHDELVFEVDKNMVQESKSYIQKCMEQTPFDGFDVKILAEAMLGEKFGEMKGF